MARISKKTKEELRIRAFGCCEYCQIRSNYAPSSFPGDHINPSSKGGKNELDNLAYSCNGCNWYKGDKTQGVDPETGQLVNLFNPRKHAWVEHFSWVENELQIIGLTPIGRATINALKLNRPNLINLRFALAAIGVHPPKHSIK